MACAVLLELAEPEVYRDNPFRLLNLTVLAGAREVARRVDELKLAAEFGVGEPQWSFGPVEVLPVERVRVAAQALKEPCERLVREFFWFWPENYPEEIAGGDEALAHVARGETAQAVEFWQGAAMQGRLASLHNMAVYYHMQALEMEQTESPPEQELIQLWFKALRFWEKIAGEEALWSRLRDRVKRMADARVTGDFVAQLRASLPEALAKICAVLALTHARQGQGERAALHAALVTHVHGDTAGARRALEEYSAPIARRIDARAVETENRLVPATGLEEAAALLRACDEDLRLIGLLCGRTSDYFGEVSHGLADTALACVVAYQRETQDDFGCLPVLLHLLDMEMPPELRGRVQETFDAIYANALVGGSRPSILLDGVEACEETNEARAFQLIVDQIVPGLDRLGLGEASRSLYASRAAGLLKDLAVAAGVERDDMDMALRAFEAALSLPLGDELRASLESDRAHLQRDFETRQAMELQVEGEGARLIINRYGICLNEVWVTPAEVTALRHGLVRAEGESDDSYVIAWRSEGGDEHELNASNLLPPSPYVEEHFARILASLYHFIVPGLIDRLAAGIREGNEVFLGTTLLRPNGVVLPGAATHFWKKDEPVSYARIETVIEDGHLIVSSKGNPRQAEAHDTALVWNAVVFGYVVEVLSRE